MRISTLDQLVITAQVSQILWDILNGSLGRKAAAQQIQDELGITVSEKLIRTYRAKSADTEDKVIDEVFQNIVTTEKIIPTNVVFQDHTQAIPVKEGKARGSKTIVVMPDVQAPLHDAELVSKFVNFMRDFQPDELAQVGDFTDSTAIGRWVRGKKGEFAGDLQYGFDVSMDILDDIRCVFDGRFRIVRSNHDDRLELYICGCAPGLELRDLTFERQLRLDEFEVEFIRDGVVELVKDEWVMGHGDEGSLSPQAGKTAFGLAKNKFGVNVVCGHTHRAGITSESYGYNGRITHSLTGFEVGHFMDLKQAEYLRKSGGTANWQQAFGILETIHGKTFAHPVMVNDGYFSFEGVLY